MLHICMKCNRKSRVIKLQNIFYEFVHSTRTSALRPVLCKINYEHLSIKVRRPLSWWDENFLTLYYTLHSSRYLLFYIEFANPIEFGNEISADQKSIILKLAEHIFGRFWIKYINLILFTAIQSCSFWKCLDMSHFISCIASCSKWSLSLLTPSLHS